MRELLNHHALVLMEAAIVERLRRSKQIRLHHTLANAPLIYDPAGKVIMRQLYGEYIDLAQSNNLPILVCTPTWRANQKRVFASNVNKAINMDAVSYMRAIRDSKEDTTDLIKIGGMIGCKNDCYRPHEGLSASASQNFHTWQIEQLAQSGVDFLIAETLPNLQEALGIAKAMAITKVPYIISFVISRDGNILDGNSLKAAIDFIDTHTNRPPLGYMVNCAHPSFLDPKALSKESLSRLIGYQANASSLDHCDLDQAADLKSDSVTEWGRFMLKLNQEYGLPILGGCCGTGIEHLQYLTSHRNKGNKLT
jgi:S-methylmethionine-dependent homocysteine/selenocysteine methylase